MNKLTLINKWFLILVLLFCITTFSFAAVTDDDLEYNYNATGSVDRLVFDKLAETVSVKDFGAVGNGSNDDTTEIQDAINFLQNSNLTGYVKFPPGTYKISSALNISGNGITLIGEGQTQTTPSEKVFINNVSTSDAINITGDNSGVQDLVIYKSANRTSGRAIRISGSDGGFVRKVSLIRCYNGINIVECQNIDLYDIDIYELYGSYGIRLYGSSTNITKNVNLRRIKTSHLSSTTFNGFRITDYVDNVEIENTRAIRGGIGVWITASDTSTGYPKNIRTYQMGTDNTNQEGYKIDAGSDIVSSNTWIGQVGASGSEYSGTTIGSGVKGNITLTNWYVRGSRRHGIQILGGQDIALLNCMVGQNSLQGSGLYSGIYIANGVDDVTIMGGKYGYLEGGGSNSQKYGIHIDGTSHDNIVIEGVNLYGNVTDYISDESASSANNFIRNNIGPDNPNDGTLSTYVSGNLSSSRPLVQWIYGHKIKINKVAAKLGTGTCNIRVSCDGVTKTSDMAVSTTGTDVTLSSPVEIDATSSPKRVEVYISNCSSASNLEVGFSYSNMH